MGVGEMQQDRRRFVQHEVAIDQHRINPLGLSRR